MCRSRDLRPSKHFECRKFLFFQHEKWQKWLVALVSGQTFGNHSQETQLSCLSFEFLKLTGTSDNATTKTCRGSRGNSIWNLDDMCLDPVRLQARSSLKQSCQMLLKPLGKEGKSWRCAGVCGCKAVRFSTSIATFATTFVCSPCKWIPIQW